MKKIVIIRTFAASMAASLALGTCTLPALADTPGLGSITIKAAADGGSLAGKTFTAYELFSLIYMNTGAEDTNADDDYAYDLKAEYEEYFIGTKDGEIGLEVPFGSSVDAVAYNYISELSAKELDAFSKSIYDYIDQNGLAGSTGVVSSDGYSCTINGLEDGYYLVFETVTEEGGTLSKGILSTVVAEVDSTGVTDTGVRNVVITQKASIPMLDKEIYHDDTGVWGKVGDSAVGDIVYYRINTTIPDTSEFTDYIYVVHDYMEDGLTFNASSLKIYTDPDRNEEVTGGWRLLEENAADGCAFEVTITQETLEKYFAEGVKSFYIYYDCTLNEKAEIAPEHNDNTSYLQYSNNPYMKEAFTEGPKHTVYDYTFIMDVTKINADGNVLANAEFQLLSGNTVLDLLKDADGNYYLRGTLEEAAGLTEVKDSTIITDSTGKIKIFGLNDAAAYTLTEIKAPAGYVKADPITFTINASYDSVTNLLNEETLTESTGAFRIEACAVKGTIMDTAQPPLPVTGGFGTRVIYVISVGTGLMAAVCMIVARRKKHEA